MDEAIRRAIKSFERESNSVGFNNKRISKLKKDACGKKHWKSRAKQLRDIGWGAL